MWCCGVTRYILKGVVFAALGQKTGRVRLVAALAGTCGSENGFKMELVASLKTNFLPLKVDRNPKGK